MKDKSTDNPTDKEFLQWIHDRLINVHGENEHFDYMHKLRAVIDRTPPDQSYKPIPIVNINVPN
jgi:hypothetical protein